MSVRLSLSYYTLKEFLSLKFGINSQRQADNEIYIGIPTTNIQLSSRQEEILFLLANQCRITDIADILQITRGTINTQLRDRNHAKI